MADEDPYALSSDSSDEDSNEESRKPPPKIAIEGRSDADFQRIKQSLIEEKKLSTKDEKTLEEIAELKRIKGEELNRFKQNFEKGIIHRGNDTEDEERASSGTMPEKPTGIDKEKLSAFKNKFENMNTTLEREEKTLEGVGKENLTNMKNMFEKHSDNEFIKTSNEDQLLSLLKQKSDTEKRRLRAAFDQNNAIDGDDEEKQSDCCICGKIVYPVEKIIVSKKIYHNICFKCNTCGKKLSPTTFNSHKGLLYCRAHMLDILHPERAAVADSEENNDERVYIDSEDEDDEFAVSSKPKRHTADVVQAGGSSVREELSALREQLQNKKKYWEQSKNEDAGSVLHSQTTEEIIGGNVRTNLDKFAMGIASENEIDKEEKEEKQKQLDAIRSQVSEVKNKWKTGDVMTAETSSDAVKNEELEALKKGPKVKERFCEGTEESGPVVKSYDRSELDTSNVSEARKLFIEGSAFQSSTIGKTLTNELSDLKFEGLRSFKDKFEKGEFDNNLNESKEKSALEIDVHLRAIKQALERGTENLADMSPEARAERKKQEIEAEFLRYKLARKIQAKRQAEQAAAETNEQTDDKEDNKSGLDVDIKMAGKAREKFKNIDAQNPGAIPIPKATTMDTKKYNKKEESIAEIINKRTFENEESSSDEDNFDVKNLMNKFKNIENISPNKVEKRLDELEALRVEARNLRKHFEQMNDTGNEQDEERKRRQLEEEFRYLKEERERAQKELEKERQTTTEETGSSQKDDIHIAEAHASKMTAKWEKIHKKEAKKAQKSQMPQKLNVDEGKN